MRKTLLLGLLAVTGLASAGEVSRQGKVWPITERDMREVIAEDIAKVNPATVAAAMNKSIAAYMDSQPDMGLPPPRTSTTRWLDLTWTSTEDLIIPYKKPDGTLGTRVLYPAGTKVNPIEVVRPTDALVFFNGNNKRQVLAVKELVKTQPYRWVLIETAGNPGKSTKEIGRPVFHASPDVLQRFAISHVPAVVYAGSGEHRLHYGVSTVADPYSAEDFNRIKDLAFPKPK